MVTPMLKWMDLELRLRKGKTIDQQELTLLEEERKRWRNVLTRLISIILGSSQHLYEPDNGNFLKEVELLAKFDPVMENHLARIKDESTHTHYLWQRIQNELIQIITKPDLPTNFVGWHTTNQN
ncbi:hypothetical protein N1851_021993 [Merluccius polli]|uniref:Uncharacterized protein n=1 Tax=Merluccius polli TaxID=89951 RepID=A0AA47NXL7_MERPO|nr:hypothetical protein N1851_021993 [Merluccius polli]